MLRESIQKMNKLLSIMLVGPPGSGKTFLRKTLMKRYNLNPAETVVVSIDDYITTQEPGIGYYDAFQKYIEHCLIYIGGRIGAARVDKHNIIFDISNVSTKLRKLVCEALPEHYHVACNIQVPKGIRMERLNSREGQKVPEGIVDLLEKEWKEADIKREPWLDEVIDIRND